VLSAVCNFIFNQQLVLVVANRLKPFIGEPSAVLLEFVATALFHFGNLQNHRTATL